ncbi:galactose-6-phosphate isomerase subunit LacA [Atopobacter phocae]|uniref:galactose-6-phosphate isomerase subunit LacA n=1 Tax=Atopobacter phocae TaxID=136492 RepID=UPI00046F6680|nr:galactose-6-phosphate isomerase subunit LacA [Atopobacter phocae]
MRVVIGADKDGFELKNMIKARLIEREFDILDQTTEAAEDFVEATKLVAQPILENDDTFGIVIDAYGAGSFMTATKIKGMVVAEVSDERSAYMTREHNNARMITLGAKITGVELAWNIVQEFLAAKYDGGRHQIRVDMLNKMA